MLRFQQVTVESVLFISLNYIFIFQAGLTIAEVHFKEEEEVDKKEPLLMEHFSLPIGLWFVGTLITIILFLAEIIINYINKKEATQGEPIETQTESERNLPDMEEAEVDQVQGSEVVTFQQEVQHNTDVQDIEDIEVVEDIEDKKITLTT